MQFRALGSKSHNLYFSVNSRRPHYKQLFGSCLQDRCGYFWDLPYSLPKTSLAGSSPSHSPHSKPLQNHLLWHVFILLISSQRHQYLIQQVSQPSITDYSSMLTCKKQNSKWLIFFFFLKKASSIAHLLFWSWSRNCSSLPRSRHISFEMLAKSPCAARWLTPM